MYSKILVKDCLANRRAVIAVPYVFVGDAVEIRIRGIGTAPGVRDRRFGRDDHNQRTATSGFREKNGKPKELNRRAIVWDGLP
jgi:hypothetical protein